MLIWSHIAMSPRESEIRDFVIMSVMAVLLLTWIGESLALPLTICIETDRFKSASVNVGDIVILPGN